MIKLPKRAQTVFNKVATHLLKQKKRSQFGAACLYRSRGGLKCAAGCLIPDKQYHLVKSFEGHNWRRLVHDKIVSSSHYNLISSLQIIHDCEDPSDWKRCLRKVAMEFELNTKILEKFD